MPQTRSPCARLSRAHRNTAGSAPALPPIRPRAGNTRTPSLHETDEDAGRLCAIPPLGVGNEEEQQSLVAPVSFYVHTVESDHAQDDRPSVLRLPPGGGSCYPVFLVCAMRHSSRTCLGDVSLRVESRRIRLSQTSMYSTRPAVIAARVASRRLWTRSCLTLEHPLSMGARSP